MFSKALVPPLINRGDSNLEVSDLGVNNRISAGTANPHAHAVLSVDRIISYIVMRFFKCM